MYKQERKLNDKQVLLLRLAFRFRYLTADNVSKLHGISHNSAYSALTKLTERGYLGRKYNKSYRLKNKSARYYLTPKAVAFLQDPAFDLDKEILATRRYEDKKSTSFIDHQVAIVDTYIDITMDTNRKISRILTASDISKDDRESYPKPLPDLEVLYGDSKTDESNHLLVDVFPDDQHLFIAKKRIRQYIQHYEDNDWDWDEYPDVLIIRRSKSDVNNLNKYITEKMEEAYMDEREFTLNAGIEFSKIEQCKK